jgi:mRNA interferase MazF
MVAVRRGNVVVAAPPGDYGKPRPALVVQADDLTDVVNSVIICPFSTTIEATVVGRVLVAPTDENGLQKPSILMIEKVTAVHHSRISRVIGTLDEVVMRQVDVSLAIVLGLK